MRTESNNSFQYGFVLTEAEFRRFISIAEDQISKLSSNSPETSYEIRFRNGAVALTRSLDEVLSQENLGSSQIVQLRTASSSANDANNSITIQFTNLDSLNESATKPVSFSVKGDSRDWTFVTTSLLEERMLKVKRLPILRYLGGKGQALTQLYVNVALVGVVIGLFFVMNNFRMDTGILGLSPNVVPDEGPKPAPFSERLEAELRNKNIKDPIEAFILRERVIEKRVDEARDYYVHRLEESRLQTPRRLQIPWYVQPILFGLIPPLGLFGLRAFFIRYFPIYNFCWGDYADYFKRKESARKFIGVVVIIGIIVSFIGGVLANYFRFGK